MPDQRAIIFEHWQDIDEPERLDAKTLILHQPIKESIPPVMETAPGPGTPLGFCQETVAALHDLFLDRIFSR
jgi:hypothetical protein